MADDTTATAPVIPHWAALVSPDCTCRWVQTPGDVGYQMTAADPQCVLHGAGRVFDAGRRELF